VSTTTQVSAVACSATTAASPVVTGIYTIGP
jgi:hypothetical protein